MKRLLLSLLAVIAWPANVNAEIIRLKCGTTEFNINEKAGKVVVKNLDNMIIKSNELFSSSDTFIIEFTDDTFQNQYQINRTDGSYKYKLWTKLRKSHQLMADLRKVSLKVIDNENKKAANFNIGRNPCEKVEEVKTMF